MSTQPPAPDFIPDDEMPDFISDEDMQHESFGLEKTTGISALPASRSPIRIPAIPGLTGTPTDLPFSPEGVAEALPAVAASGAALLTTRHPGIAATVGGMAGEAGRQLFRRVIGEPAATGVAQRALGLDPDSPGAAAASLGGEALAGLVGAGAAKTAKGLSRFADESAQRSIVRDILGGARTEREVSEAPALAKRAQAAGILRSMTKKGQMSRAQSALGTANRDAAAKTQAARQAGATVEAGPVLDAIQNELPASIPGSGAPRKSVMAERRAVGRLLDDELSAVANTADTAPSGYVRLYRGQQGNFPPLSKTPRLGESDRGRWFTTDRDLAKFYGDVRFVDVPEEVSVAAIPAGEPYPSNAVSRYLSPEWANKARPLTGTEVPLNVALGEIDALDDQLEAMYRRGALDPALGKTAAQSGAKAFRVQLRAALPEVADARLKQHELITITEMIQRRLDEGWTRGKAHAAAGLAGSAVVGRYGPPAAGIFSAIAGDIAPLTIPARQILAKVFAGGANTAQLWVRAADLAGLNKTPNSMASERERRRKAEAALRAQAEGTVGP